MAEPAENLNPEPIASDPASQPSQGPANDPNVQFGTFLQFGKQEYRNVTVAGIDSRTGNILAFRRSGDDVRRVLIPRADYEEALKTQKAVEKRTGRKQKAFIGRFVGSLMNRPILHNGENAQVIGYDAQRGEALVSIDGQKQWIGAGALLESQKNISIVRGEKKTESSEPVQESVERSPTKKTSVQTAEATFNETEKSVSKEASSKKIVPLSIEEFEQAEAEADEPELIVEDLSDEEAKQITEEAEAIELQEALQNAKVVEALEGASIANVLPAPLIKSLSTPVAPGSVAEKRRDLQIEQAYQQFAKGKSPEDLSKVLGGLTQEFRQIDASTLPEMQPLREIQAKLVTSAASDLKSKGVLLPEISARLTGNSLQTARDLAATVEISGGVPVAASMPAVIAVAASPVAGTQSEVLSKAQAAVNILERQISEQQNKSESLLVQITQASDQINTLGRQAAALPEGEERVVIEGQIASAENQRNRLQEQLTNISVQLGNDRRDQSALKASIANISQAPAGQAPPELVTDLANKIPARLAPQIAEPSVIPAKAGIQPEPVDSRLRGNDTVQPVPTAPARRVSPSAPAPVRSPSAPVQQVRAPLRALPNVGRDSQRAAQLISDQQEDLFDGQELPEESEELIPDTYEQAMSEEGGVGGELSPLEIGTQMPDTSMTYAAGGNVEEGPEPGDFFMERETAGRKRMADVNRQTPARPARDTSRTATDIARKPAPPAVPAGQTPAPTAAGAPNARESSRFQRLLNQQSRAIAKRDQAQAGFDKLKTAQDAQANLDSIKKLKRIYDVAKAGSALTFWGIVVAVLIANIQTINKYTVKIKVIPSTTLVEDVAIVILDLMLLQVMICATAILLVVPAIIIAVIVGAFTFADASGFFDLISGIFS